MIWLLLDIVPDPNNENPSFNVITEINEEEVNRIKNCFSFCSPYSTLKMAIDVAVENGNQLVKHMDPSNLLRYRNGGKQKNAATTANRFALNYATSIKTFIDFTERQIRKHYTEKELKIYQNTQHQLYDNNFEYRFWMRLRNYIVHRSFPYSKVNDSINGMKVLCLTEKLLEYDKWNDVRKDLLAIGDFIEPEKMVDKMNVLLTVLRFSYMAIFSESIVRAVETYGGFCKKYGIKYAAFSQVESRHDVEKGNLSVNPMPVNMLLEAFDELKMNPHITFNFVDDTKQ